MYTVMHGIDDERKVMKNLTKDDARRLKMVYVCGHLDRKLKLLMYML